MDVESKYKIKGSDFTLLRNKMILSSNEEATIKDLLQMYQLPVDSTNDKQNIIR
mgnify:CR=1 FL=1